MLSKSSSKRLLPYFMHNFVQPEFVEVDLADKILKQLNYDFSKDLNVKSVIVES